jgi:hypothetical protein
MYVHVDGRAASGYALQERVSHAHTTKCGDGQTAGAAAVDNASLLAASVALACPHADAEIAPARRHAGGCASTTPYMDPASLPSSTSCSMPYSGSAALPRALPRLPRLPAERRQRGAQTSAMLCFNHKYLYFNSARSEKHKRHLEVCTVQHHSRHQGILTTLNAL